MAGVNFPIARELITDGTRVDTIMPGIFNTSLLQAASDNVKDALAASATFPQHLGHPEEFAQLVKAMLIKAISTVKARAQMGLFAWHRANA